MRKTCRRCRHRSLTDTRDGECVDLLNCSLRAALRVERRVNRVAMEGLRKVATNGRLWERGLSGRVIKKIAALRRAGRAK